MIQNDDHKILFSYKTNSNLLTFIEIYFTIIPKDNSVIFPGVRSDSILFDF